MRRKPSCGNCQEGWVIVPDAGCGTAIRCACRRNGDTSHEYRQIMEGVLGFPLRLTRGFKAPKPWPRVSNVEASLEQWKGAPWCVYLWGPIGRGKSMLAVELAWRCISACRTSERPWKGARFVTCREVVDETYSGRSRFREPGPLVLDDLGQGVAPAHWPAIGSMLSDRWNYKLPTLITGHGSLSGIAGAYPEGGARLASRLSDGWVVRVDGERDRRGALPFAEGDGDA